MTKFAARNLRGAKLSGEQVFEMRKLYAEGWSQRALAEYFNLSVNHVGRIVRGESRRDVPEVLPEEDHEAVRQRLAAVQEAQATALLDKITEQARAERDATERADKELEALASPAAKKFGINKGDPK